MYELALYVWIGPVSINWTNLECNELDLIGLRLDYNLKKICEIVPDETNISIELKVREYVSCLIFN